MGSFVIYTLACRRQDFPGEKRGVAVAGGDGEQDQVLHPSATEPIPNGPCLTQRLQGLVPARRPCFLLPVTAITGANEERGVGHRLLLFPKCQSSRSIFWHLKRMTAEESYRHRVLCGSQSPICAAGQLVPCVPSAVAKNTGIFFNQTWDVGSSRGWCKNGPLLIRTFRRFLLGCLSLARGSDFVLR